MHDEEAPSVRVAHAEHSRFPVAEFLRGRIEFGDVGHGLFGDLFDHRHVLTTSGTYRFPSPAGAWPRALLGDWRITGVLFVQSGSPFTVNLGVDRANIGTGPAQRPDQTCDPNSGGAQTSAQWFNTACFALQPQFAFGNAPRNSVLAPGYADVDLGVQRDITLRGDTRLQLRWEVFNVFNRVRFAGPATTLSDPFNFGKVTSQANAPRSGQFALKLNF